MLKSVIYRRLQSAEGTLSSHLIESSVRSSSERDLRMEHIKPSQMGSNAEQWKASLILLIVENI